MKMRKLKRNKQITTCDQNYLEKYIHEIVKESLLTPSEEVELYKKIKKGDKEALDKLVKANLRFVVSVSKQYTNQGLSLGDLITEGNLGLIKASKRFDPTKGFKFISYAVWWCRQTIMQAIAECSRLVRLPMNKCAIRSKRRKTKLEQKEEITQSSLSENLERKEDEIKSSLKKTGRYISIDAPLGSVEYSNISEVNKSEYSPTPDRELIKESMKRDIFILMRTLSSIEREIIEKGFGLDGKPPRTLDEIGKEQNLTRERVRQIKYKACKKLIKSSSFLKYYLYLFN